MSATAVISIVNQHRIRRALTWLEGRVPAEEELIVGATLDAANELARRIAKESGAAFGWYRLTLSQLAATIAAPALAARGLIPLTRVGTEAIVARLVHRLRAEGGLGRYDAVSATPGFPRAVAGVIAELRVARVPSDVVGSVAPDLVPLIGAYEAELAEAGLADWPDVLMLATEAAGCAGPDRHRLIGFPMLFLDVPLGSEAEVAFVRALATAAPEVLATVPTGDEPTLRRIRAGLGMQIENLDDASSGDNGVAAAGTGTLSDLQRYLFNEQARPSETSPDNAVEVFSAPGEGRECVEIARRVLSLAGRGFRSTGSPCCCVHRRCIAPTLRRHSTERTFRFTSHVARCDPTRPGAPSVPYSRAQPKACRRNASPSTFRLGRCLTRRPAARRRRLFRVATPLKNSMTGAPKMSLSTSGWSFEIVPNSSLSRGNF